MVAAAVIGGAVLGAAGSVYAADSASSATNSATNANIAEQRQALDQQATLSAPYRGLGEKAIPLYEQLLGLNGGNADSIQKALASTPGYQFALDQGETGILNAASASGGVGGNTLAALDKYNVGMASQTYQQVLDNTGRAVGTGQAAAAGQAQNVGNTAANIGSALTNQGNTNAGIDANLAAGLTKSIGNTTDAYITGQTLTALQRQNSAWSGGGASGGYGDASGIGQAINPVIST